MAAPNLKIKKRMIISLIIFALLSVTLIVRIGWWQIKEGESLQKQAIEQQTRDRQINSKRGTIYDRNGKPIAISASVETVCATPAEVKKSGKSDEIASKLSEILDIEFDIIYDKINRKSADEIIKRKIEKDIADQIREFNFPGIYLIEDSKRYYPYGNFAAHLIGATGTDNEGLFGLEAKYDKYLKGLPGRIVSAKDAIGTDMPYKYEKYISAEDGTNIILTIDEVIQHFVEKHLETAAIENKVDKGAVAIVANPNTGEILAMAVKPDFDLNNPFTIQDPLIQEELTLLSGEEYIKRYNIELGKMWRNKVVVDSYEPGSTFKIITSAIALEENLIQDNEVFNCGGSILVGGARIKCWRHYRPHGVQTFVEAIQNSCNPVFVQLGLKIGRQSFYRYMKAFGLMEKTGIDFMGETAGIPHPENRFNELELATAAFGQGFQITPLQMITAVSAVANGGNLLRPQLVKQFTDIEGNIIKDFQPEIVRQVLSKKTTDKLNIILESVVSEGTGDNAYIKGYRVAGKTGTSEKSPRGRDDYIASFVGYAPADNPKVICLLLLDEPRGESYFGGLIAAPVVGKILDDVLTYLEVEPKFTEEELKDMDVIIPEVRGLLVNEAQEKLNEIKLAYKVNGNGDTIINQTPKPGVQVKEDSLVIFYTESSEENTNIIVPDLKNKTVLEANKILTELSLNIRVIGSGTVYKQEPEAGTAVSPASIVAVEFRNTEVD